MNKEMASKSNINLDGIFCSLNRMYDCFEINKTKYKKVALINKIVDV